MWFVVRVCMTLPSPHVCMSQPPTRWIRPVVRVRLVVVLAAHPVHMFVVRVVCVVCVESYMIDTRHEGKGQKGKWGGKCVLRQGGGGV